MKKMKRFMVSLLASLVLVCCTASVLPESVGVVTAQAAGVQLNKTNITLNVGQKYRLKVTGTTKKVTWKTGNPKIATVGSKGLVTAKKAGTARIVAVVEGKKYTCMVKVVENVFSASSTNVTVGVNSTATIYISSKNNGKLKFAPSNSSNKIANCQWDKETGWVDGKIALYITGKAPGTTKITITSEKNNKSVAINVKVVQTNTNVKNTLKDYITKNGKTSSDGDKFISYETSSNGTSSQFAIFYLASKDSFQFTSIITTSKNKTSTTMEIKNGASSTQTTYISASQTSSAGFTGTATVNIPSYTKNTQLNFSLKLTGYNNTQENRVEMAKDANSKFRQSMAGWNTLLRRADLSMRDMGFTSYN